MIDDSAISMGRAITAAREDRGIERGELADRAGVSHPYLGELEQGRRSGTPLVLERIASALSVTTQELHAAAAAIGRGAPPSFPPSFLYDSAAEAPRANATVDVRQRAAAEPMARLRPLAPGADVAEEVIVRKLTARVRAEVERWLDSELEAAVRAEVRRQRAPEA